MDKIIIQGLQVYSLIGVYDWERESKTQLLVDVELSLDLHKAAESDDVQDTVDYAAVAQLLVDTADTSEYQLLEALARQMIDQCFSQFPLLSMRLTLSKPDILPNAQNVAIQMTREA